MKLENNKSIIDLNMDLNESFRDFGSALLTKPIPEKEIIDTA